jgi:type IV secretory pathway VirJ component
LKSISLILVLSLGVAPALSAQLPTVTDLPLTEVAPRADSIKGSASNELVIFFTGDGGWATLDRSISKELAAHGAIVVGFNSREYIEHQHDPVRFASDVERLMNHYMSALKKSHVVLVGYSRGAELAPFAVSRLPADLRSHVDLLALLGLSPGASFHFRFEDLFRNVVRPTDLPTIPEIEKLRGMKVLCIYGKDEDVTACRSAPSGLMTVVERPGGHHFDDNYSLLGRIILGALP